MKVRVTIIDVDEVAPVEVGEILGRALVVGGTPPAPALPAPQAPAEPHVKEGPERRMAALPRHWRPRTGNPRRHQLHAENASVIAPRPETPAMRFCAGCGADHPAPGKPGRFNCVKCGGRQWTKVPARVVPDEVKDPAAMGG